MISMVKYDKKYLQKVLKKHGYEPLQLTDGAWLLFATQLLILEKLEKQIG